MMVKCEWCGKNTNKTNVHIDGLGDTHNICDECKNDASVFRCRKCKMERDSAIMINGVCTYCMQVQVYNKCKKQEEIRMGVDKDMLEPLISELELSDEDYERWLTMGNAYTPNDLKKSKELRYIWILVKLNSVGGYSNDVVRKHFNDIEELLDRNFSKLIGNKCRLIIGDNSANRRIIRDSAVIDYINQSYIVEA